ncbi:Crp/Fnr family transcriptional regulator [Dyadobacter psychrotolerans]|nr:Crp/Fnr family transcriptional regulator [Dyadobacter psychrotolerans]
MANTRLLEFLSLLAPHGGSCIMQIATLFEFVPLRKGDALLTEGQVCSAFYFVEMGALRTFITKEGAEINLHFHLEGELTSDYKNGKIGNPSPFTIEACEKCEVWLIDRKKLEALCHAHPDILTFARRLLTYMLLNHDTQDFILRVYNARDRYAHLERTNPRLLHRVSLSNLASYLGMNRRTITRIRQDKLRHLPHVADSWIS